MSTRPSFAKSLRAARIEAGLTVTRLAELAGTSRAAITDYEAARKTPRFDTAERIFRVLGRALIPVAYPKQSPVRLDDDVIAPLVAWAPDREALVQKAYRDRAVIVDADVNAERLDLTWGQVKTIVDGTTVTGDELSIWRTQQLTWSAARVLHGVEQGKEPRLEVIARGTLVTDDPDQDVPRRALSFLTRATRYGADPAFTRHLVGGFLAHHGYPWLWIPHRFGAEYRRALVACTRHGEGNLMARVLIASIEPLD
jgi:transcriptional regulator with XRE-family HTH domain